MAENPDLLAELDALDDKPENEAQPEPEVGVSETARKLESEGYFDGLSRQFSFDRDQAHGKAEIKSRDSVLEGITDPQQYAEGLKGIIPGAVRFVGGTIPKGLARLDPVEAISSNSQRYVADLRRVHEMAAEELSQFRMRVEKEPAPATRIAVQSAISDLLDGTKTLDDIELQFSPSKPLAERPLYKAGEVATEFSKKIAPAAKGYENSAGRQVGEGLGSMAGGLPFALFGTIPAAVVFGAGGMGEAAERAVEFDRAEKAQGRAGLSDEQINTAALLGVGPGTTDVLPIEVMLGRLPLPLPPWLRGAVARAIGRVGGQTFVEGFQEGGQQFLQNLIAREIYKPDQQLFDDVPSNVAMGGGVGAIAQGAKEVGSWLLWSASGRRGHRAGQTTGQETAQSTEGPAKEPAGIDLDQYATESPASPSPRKGGEAVETEASPEEAESSTDSTGLETAPPPPSTSQDSFGVEQDGSAETAVERDGEERFAASMVRKPLSEYAQLNLEEALEKNGFETSTDLSTLPPGDLRKVAADLRLMQADHHEVQKRYERAPKANAEIAEALRAVNAELTRDRAFQKRQGKLPLESAPPDSSQDSADAIESVASAAHDDWRAPRKREDGSYEPRVKATKDPDWIRRNDGRSEVDIANTGYSDLPPEWQAENRVSAQTAVGAVQSAIAAGQALDAKFIEAAASRLHDAWVERNESWADPALKKPYDQLSEVEKEKDRVFVRRAISAVGTKGSPQQVQETAEKSTEGTQTEASINQADLDTRFREILAGKTPRSGWADALDLDVAELQPLVDKAVSDGLLRVDSRGRIMRTEKAKQPPSDLQNSEGGSRNRAETAATPAAAGPSLTIAPDVRLEGAIRAREGAAGKPITDKVKSLASGIETARVDDQAFRKAINKIKRDKKLAKADVLELANLVGYPAKKSWSKAKALQSIVDRQEALAQTRGRADVLRQIQEAGDARLRETEGSLPEGELPAGVRGDAGGRDAEGASGPGGPGGGRDVAGPAVADDDVTRPAGALPGEGEGTGVDPREGAGDGGVGADLRPAAPTVDTAAVREQVDADAAREEQARADRVAKNYVITDADEIGKGGAKAKVRGNLAAIRILRQLEDEKRPATEDEKKTLVKYVGWGAFAQDVFATHKPEWAKERAELQNLLSPEEYKSARASTLNAHYTSPEVIKGMWSTMEWLGFTGGRVIEPAAGIGHFIGLQPEAMRAQSDWTAVELDKVSGGITKALYGASDVRIGGFEEQVWPDDYFDLAISNVPFGDFKVEDADRKGFLIHDYFFVKALAKVRPGGIVAFITSTGTLDKLNPRARTAMMRGGTFLGAIRLPGGSKGAFKANAGTDVTTDIIFLRKRIPGEPVEADADWMNRIEIKTPEGPTEINGYFAANPDMMLGKMRLLGSMYGKGEPVLIGSSEGLSEKITEAAQKLPEDALLPATTSAAHFEAELDTEVDAIKEGAFYAKDGKIYRKVTGVGVAQKLNKGNAERVERFIALRDTVNHMLAIQSGAVRVEDRAGEMDELRIALNKDYDGFVAKFGPINLTNISEQKRKDGKVITIRRMPNFSVLEEDNDAYKVAALEVYDEKTQTARKAAIFSEDIVGAYQRPAVTGPSDALAVSLNERGRVDMVLIADQLGVSEQEAAATLGDRVFRNPAGGQWQTAAQYLSGDVVKKIEDARTAAALDKSIERNVAALEKVQPEPLTRAEITVPFGASWVPTEVYEQFLKEVVGSEFKVSMNEVTKQWRVAGARYNTAAAAQAQWGTDRKSVGEIIEAALNSKPIIISDSHRNSDGSTTSTRDIKGEEAARAKAELLREAFSGQTFPGAPAAVGGWVWTDDPRAIRLENLYNRSFNRIVKEDHDGSHLTFPGLARVVTFADGATGTINLTPARTAAIWRIIQNGNTLIDHVVGAGKTWTSIMSVMEMKRLGMIRRPMFVVPNHMLHQFSQEFLQAYPAAKLLVATKDNMSAAKRKEFAAKAAAEKWDGIIITHSAFGRLRMRDEAYVEYYQEAIDAMVEAKDQAAQAEGKQSATVKDIEKARKRLQGKLEKFTSKEKKDLGITFEELGVDHLTVDEAHLFKNLWFPTRHTRVRGISNASESQRATDLYIKIRNLEKSKPGRSTLFLTGTPLSNTMAEVYTMMRYLQHDTLAEYGIGEFDSWAQTFGNIKTKTELAPNGRDFRDTTSFGEFVNIPELAALYGRIADTQTAESLKLPRPALKGGKPTVVETDLGPGEEAFVGNLIKAMESLKGKKPVKGDPNFLSLFTQGLQVGTDFRLVDPSAPFNPDGKIAKAVDNIFRIWEQGNQNEATPNKAQLVFLDMGVPGSKPARSLSSTAEPATVEEWREAMGEAPIEAVRRGLADTDSDTAEAIEEEVSEDDAEAEFMLAGKFNLYQDIKDHLIERGVPPEQIAFIHDAKNDEQKAKLFDAVREGKVRVLIGSSAKMGVGTNVQKRLIAMHHIDAPWKPADVEQRDGRILRQGNKNQEVEIYRYVTKRSFDSYRWQILENKSHFIGQFRAGARGVRIATDIDAPLPEAAELKAAATGDPRIIEHAELSREVRVLDAQRAAHLGGAVRARSALDQAKARIESARKHLTVWATDAAKVEDLSGDNFRVDLDVAGKTRAVTERKKAGEAVKAYLSELAERSWYGAQTFDLGEISGFRMQGKVRRNIDGDGFVVEPEIAGDGTYEGEMFTLNAETNPVTLMQRFERLVQRPTGNKAVTEATIAELEREIPRLEERSQGTAFPKDAELTEKRTRLTALTLALKPRQPGQPGAEAATPEEESYVDQATRNLSRTSRTAAGVVDTSASAGKAAQMAEGLTGDTAKSAALTNFDRVIRKLYRQKDNLPTSGAEMAALADQVALDINQGILKEGALYRQDDSEKYPYTAAADLALARTQFGEELVQRLSDPDADPIETAAWIEWRANLTDHFWADGVGKTSKALAAIPLMRAGLPLPEYRDNKEFFANGNKVKRDPKAGPQAYLDQSYQGFVDYYRTLMPPEKGSAGDLKRRGDAALAVMQSPEWLASIRQDVDNDTSQAEGYGSDEWKAARTYTTPDGELVGYENAIQYLAEQAARKVPGGPKAERKVFVMLGMAGAGKSTIARTLIEQKRALHLTADDAKLILPEYEGGKNSVGVHEEASDMGKDLVQRMAGSGLNIIVEKVGSSDRSIAAVVEDFKANGYAVTLMHIDVPVEIAMERAVARWRRRGRAVPMESYTGLDIPGVFARISVSGAVDEKARIAWDEKAGKWVNEGAGLEVQGLRFGTRAPPLQPSLDGVGREPGPAGGPRGSQEGAGQGLKLAAFKRPRSLTPEFIEKWPQTREALLEEARNLLPAEVAVRLEDSLVRFGKDVGGWFDIVEPAILLEDKGDWRATAWYLRHEVIHALRNLGLFDHNHEWPLLVDHARKAVADIFNRKQANGLTIEEDYRQQYTEMLRGLGFGGETLELLVNEFIDQEYVAVLAMRHLSGEARYPNRIAKLLDRIAQFFEAVRNAFNGFGFNTIESIFEKVKSGEVAGRDVPERSLRDVVLDAAEGQDDAGVSATPEQAILSSEEGRAALRLFAIKAAPPAPPSTRPFVTDIEGFSGEVVTEVRESSGDRIRTYVLRSLDQADSASALPPDSVIGPPEQGQPPGLEALKAEGFDTDKIWYHGTSRGFSDFKSTTYFSPSKKRAEQYITMSAPRVERAERITGKKLSNPRVIESYVRPGRQLAVDMNDVKNQENIGPILDRAKADGYDTVVLKEHRDEPEMVNGKPVYLDELVVFDPKNIHRVDAAGLQPPALRNDDRSGGQAGPAGRVNQLAVQLLEGESGWEISLPRIPVSLRGKSLTNRLIQSIEQDLGEGLSSDGWLTEQSYQRWAQVQPDKVKDHQNAGPLFDNLWASPKAIRFAAAVLEEAQAKDADPDQVIGLMRQAARLQEMAGSLPEDPKASIVMAAFKSLPHPIKLGGRAQGTPTPNLEKPEKGLSELVEDVNEALGLTTRMGRLNPGLKAAAGRMGERVAGQFGTTSGVTRISTPNDIATLSHEGGHALESRADMKADLDTLKKAHVEELTTNPAPDIAPKVLTVGPGFSGVELDGDTQQKLVDATLTDRTWRQLTTTAGQAKSGQWMGKGKHNQAAYVSAQEAAARAWGMLVRRVGHKRARAYLDDVRANVPAGTAPDAYVRTRFAAGTPANHPAVTATDTELSEGFAEVFRLYVTNPTEARRRAPAFTLELEDLIDGVEPQLLQSLEGIQKGYQALLNASPAGAVRSRVQSTVDEGKIAALKEEIAEKGVKATVSDKLYAFYTAFVDSKHPLKRAVRYLLETAGENLGLQLGPKERLVLKAMDDPYKLWRLAEHSKVWATNILQNGVRFKGDVDPSGPSFHDALAQAFGGTWKGQWNEERAELFGSYLTARRMLAEFQRFEAGQLESPPDQIIDKKVWTRARADLEKAYPEFKQAAETLYRFNKNHLRLKYQAGFLTRDLFLELNSRADYVPLNRIMDDGSPSQVGKSAKGQNKRKLIYRFQGSTRDFINPIESIAQDVYATQGRIALNDVIGATERLARAAGPGGGAIAERIPASDMKGISIDIREAIKQAARGLSQNDAEGLVELIDDLFDQEASATIFKATPTEEKGEPIVYLWEEGKKVPIRLGDDRIGRDIFEGMVAFGQNNSEWWIDTAALGAQAFRAGVTKAPAYIVVNFLRDQMATWILSDKYTPFWTGFKGLKNVVADDVTAKRYKGFAGLAGVDQNLVDSQANKRDVLTLRRKGFTSAPTKWQSMLRAMEVTEAASRMGHFKAAYDRALADGMTEEEAGVEAAYAAHDVMDFSRHGSKMGTVARIVAFLNSTLQGLDAARRTMSGERDSHTAYRDLASPFLKAATGQPLSIAEKSALPNSTRIWVKLAMVGMIGVSLAALYRDDEEHEEFNDYMKATHWFFKINGVWTRVPKPFELAILSNAFEAAYDRLWKQDPRALTRFLESLRYTLAPPAELQGVAALQKILDIPTALWEGMTGTKNPYKKKGEQNPVPQQLRRLPPEMQFTAYTSELGKMIGKMLNWSPAKVDAFIADTFATAGRDVMAASDQVLPFLNRQVGGILPGVSKTPRADKSIEDYWIISRFTRREARGALSTQELWQQMSQDGGKFTQAAAGYNDLRRSGNERDARDFLNRLSPEEKAFALLDSHFQEKDKDVHPLHRAQQVMSAMAGIRKDMLLERLIKQSTALDKNHPSREPEKIVISPSKQKSVNEILEDLSMREARNALIVLKHPGWAQKQIMPTDGLKKELATAAPEVAEELDYRLTKGRTKVYPFEGVAKEWPRARDELLREGADASLSEFRSGAKFPN